MTIPSSPSPSPRQPLGRGIRELIPAASASPADQAAAALAALQAACVPVAALQAAVLLLDDLASHTEDVATRTAAQATADALRDAADGRPGMG